MQHALNELCIAATKGTQETQEALKYFLNYCATHPEAEIIYRASEMILTTDSDTAYQVAPKSRSRASGYHYLGNKDGKLFRRGPAQTDFFRMCSGGARRCAEVRGGARRCAEVRGGAQRCASAQNSLKY
jgi:hypothetical protein